MRPTRFSLFTLGFASLCAVASVPAAADEWPSFRGPFARGVADGAQLPVEWTPDGSQVRWQREIPGVAHSSPVVAAGRVFLITAVTGGETPFALGDAGIGLAKDTEQDFSWRLYALDESSGEVLWQHEAYAGRPRATWHIKASQANATPATDGKTVVAIFGSEGLGAFDATNGTVRWRTDLGVLDPGLFGDTDSHWGHASSPVIHEGRVFVQVDRHAESFIAAFDLASGRQIWKVERQEKPVWATPTIHQGQGRTQLLVLGGDFDRGLDPETGAELWRFARDLEVKTTTPFVADDLVILSGGYRGKEIHAVSVDAEGAVEGDELVWTSEAGGPYTSTPVAYRGRLYFVRDTGIFNVLDLATGEGLHRQRLEGTYSASPIASDGKIYLASEDGVVRVLSAEAPFGEIAANDMGEPCMASPAISDGTLFIRTSSRLYAISNEAGSLAGQ